MKKVLIFMLAFLGLSSVAFAYDDYGSDLVIKDITYLQANQKIDVQVSNLGTVDVSSPFRIRLEVDGQSYYFRINQRINANRTMDFYVDMSNFDVSKNQMLVLGEVDVDGVINEVNKSNNRYVGYIYLYPQNTYSDHRYYDDTTSNYNDNRSYRYPCCDTNDRRYNRNDCSKYNNDFYNGDYTYYTDTDTLSISQIDYDQDSQLLRVRVSNNSSYQRAANLQIRVDMNGYTRYYTLNQTINRKSYVYLNVNIRDFNANQGSSYFVRAQIVGNSNSLSKNISISDNGYSNGVDLKVTAINYDRNSNRLKIRVDNKGDYTSNGSFRVKVDLNGYIRYYQVDSNIGSNSYIRVYAYVDDFDIGSSRYYSVSITADPDDRINETNENNNTYSQSIYFYY